MTQYTLEDGKVLSLEQVKGLALLLDRRRQSLKPNSFDNFPKKLCAELELSGLCTVSEGKVLGVIPSRSAYLTDYGTQVLTLVRDIRREFDESPVPVLTPLFGFFGLNLSRKTPNPEYQWGV